MGGVARWRGLLRAALAAALLVACCGASTLARAQTALAPSCDALWALDAFSPSDLAALHAACRDPEQRAAVLRALEDPASASEASLRSLDVVHRLTTRAWASALFVALFSPLRSERGAVVGLPCDLDADVRRFVRARKHKDEWLELRQRALSRGACADELWRRLASPQPGKAATAARAYALVVVFALADERVQLLYGGRSPRLLEPTRVVESRDGRVVYAAWVPRQVPLVIVTRPPDDLPRGKRVIVNDDVEHWSASDPIVCLDLELVASANAEVLLDGHPLGTVARREWSSIVYLAEDDHQLTVLGAPSPDPPREVLLNQQLAVADLRGAHACARLRFDLSAPAITGLLAARAASTCLEAGVDSARVRHHTVQYLKARGEEPRDLEMWGESIVGLSDLRDTMARMGGAAVGAPKGRTDSWDALGSAATELKRQGFRRVLWLELHCSRSSQGWDYSFVARSANLERLWRQRSAPGQELSLEDVIDSAIEIVSDRRALARGIESPLAQALGLPYVQFASSEEKHSYHDEVAVELEAYLPPPAEADAPATGPFEVQMRARRLDDAEASQTCSAVTAAAELRQPPAATPSSARWRSIERRRLERPGIHGLSLSVTPHGQGVYLVEARLLEAAEGVAATAAPTPARELAPAVATCLTVLKPVAEFFLDVSRSWSGLPVVGERWNALTDARLEQYSAHRLLLGLRWRRGPVAFAFGYERVRRAGLTPPSFDDLETAEFAGDGTQSYTVKESAVLFGPVFAGDTSVCELAGTLCGLWWRRFSLAGRALLLGQVAFVDRRRIPEELVRFRDPELEGDVDTLFDVGVLLQGGISVQMSNRFSLAGFLNLGVPRVVQRLSDGGDGTFQFDGRFVSGVSLSVGASL